MDLINSLANVVAPVFYKLVCMSLTGVAVGAVLLIIRKCTDKKISPSWKYLMWTCLLVALIMPFRLESPISVMGSTSIDRIEQISYREQMEQVRRQTQRAATPKAQPQAEQSNAIQPKARQAVLTPKQQAIKIKYNLFDVFIPLIWLGGVGIYGLIFLVGARKLMKKTKGKPGYIISARSLDMLEKCKARLGITADIKMTVQQYIQTPAMFGLFRPKILLPEYVEEISEESLECVLLHELCHYKRRDILINYLLIALQGIYWFNPLLLIGFKCMRQDLELANDAYVLKYIEREHYKKYSKSLLEVVTQCAHTKPALRLLYMADDKSSVERRIKMIKQNDKFKKNKTFTAIGSLAIIGVICVLFLTSGKSEGVPEKVWEGIAAQQLSFQEAETQSDFKMNSATFKKTEGWTRITFEMESYNVASCWLFSPPNGEIIDERRVNGMKEGKNTVTFDIPDEAAKQTPKLTFTAYTEGANQSFIYVQPPEFFGEAVVWPKALEIGETPQEEEVPATGFYPKDGKSHPLSYSQADAVAGFAINSARFRVLEGKIEITYDLESPVDGKYFLFCPNDDRKFADTSKNAVKVGNNKLVFELTDAEMSGVDGLTLQIANEAKTESFGYSYFDTVQLIPGKLEKYADVRGGWGNGCDLSEVEGIDTDMLVSLTFNKATIFPSKSKMSADVTPEQLTEMGKNPGLGVRDIHKSGITGKGVNVAIIDQPLYTNHPEFDGKIAKYKDFGCESEASMHGPAVASLLVGENIGTAPGARIYYAAAPSWKRDSKYYADALDWIVEENAALPKGEKIRVVSVSAAPSGMGSPFEKNNEMWDVSVKKANEAGILVLDCGQYGFISSAYLDIFDAENADSFMLAFPDSKMGRPIRKELFVPTSRRTVAEQYQEGEPSYQYTGVGGLSWGIPYATGVYALGFQIHPEYTYQQMTDLLYETAYVKYNATFINPTAFIKALQAK